MPPKSTKQKPDAPVEPSQNRTYQDGYADGYAAALKAQRPSLFDAAKKVCADMYDALDDDIAAQFDALEKEYEETISAPDRRLLNGIVRRHRVAAEAQRQALMSRPRPKSDVGLTVAKRLDDAPAETAYEVVK